MLRSIFKFFTTFFVPLALYRFISEYISVLPGTWYDNLNKPGISPPGYFFESILIILFILMGLSFFHIWIKPRIIERTIAKIIYVAQLILVFTWLLIFFHFHNILLSLIVVAFLLVAVVLMIIKFYRLKPLAAYLNFPYLLWVIYIAIFNISIFVIN